MQDFFCHDLPTQPLLKTGTILVTGASGYIGGRLFPELLERGYPVRIMLRAESPVYKNNWPKVETVVADALNFEQLKTALEGVDTAYYLIHSLLLGPKKFETADIKAAANFRIAAELKHLKRIIYLGGLGDIRNPLSPHLHSRIKVAEELRKGKVPVTILRAAIIIGSGSASYEIIKNLVKKLPVMLMPHWTKNRCQPIAVRDVIKYLVGVLEVPETKRKNLAIGGKDVLTYEKMLKIHSRIIHKNTIFIPFFFSNIRFYAYFASILTPVPNAITQCLIEGLKNEVFCQDDSIKRFIPFEPISYREAVIRALLREERDRVYTRWSDAYPPAHELALKLHELDYTAAYIKQYSIYTKKESSALFNSICTIGGREGWFDNNWMWRLRGMADRILLGVGTSRGRKSYSHLEINDVIDFWRIENLEKNRRLLLRAEMKLPGRAWLEFNIKEEKDKRKLSVIAYYDTNTILGKMYWYIFLPFHHFIFIKLLEDIERRS